MDPLVSKVKVLLVLTGSVASIKALDIVKDLLLRGCEVRVIATHASTHFFNLAQLEEALCTQVHCTPIVPSSNHSLLANRPQALTVNKLQPYPYATPTHDLAPFVHFDIDEWLLWRSIDTRDPVLHIALRDWADVLLIAPASASFLARAAQGACSDLASCVWRAWHRSKPIVLAPAMNTAMWEHPATQRHLTQIALDFPGSVALVPPQSKLLACGDVGVGAMAAPALIAAAAAAAGARKTLPSGVSLIESAINNPGTGTATATVAEAEALPSSQSGWRRRATDIVLSAALAFAAMVLFQRVTNTKARQD